ncbi:MAG: hypothetical protein CMJ35_09590 [Phycisphaerae bacterium]|nr:hypothetical protein [Phycisphaerae bacterium]MBM91847.1 hypothetical protein [Phycisphaerae bacterium]
MSVIFLILLLIAFLFVGFGVEGRVVANGLFCPKCGYDLDVLRNQLPFARCPECGMEFGPGVRPNTELREKRKWLFVLAAVVVLLPIAIGYSRSPSGKAMIYSSLPDSVVVNFAIEGDSIALADLMSRAIVAPGEPQLDEELWDTIIEHTLVDIQQALVPEFGSRAFVDARWGELLVYAINHRQLTNEQLIRYVTDVMDYQIELPTRLAIDSEHMYYKALHKTGVARWVGYKDDRDRAQFVFEVTLLGVGVSGQDPVVPVNTQVFKMGLLATGPGTDHVDKVPSYGMIGGIAPLLAGQESDTIDLYARSRISIYDGVTNELLTSKDIETIHPCEVLPREMAMPKLLEEDDVRLGYCDRMNLGKISVYADTRAEFLPDEGEPVMAIGVRFPGDIEHGIALDVLVRVGDETLQIGSCVRSPLFNDMYSYRVVTLNAPALGSPERLRMIKIINTMLNKGRVEVLLRTNPERALGYPGIDQVVDIRATFQHVGVLSGSKASQRPHPYYGYTAICE